MMDAEWGGHRGCSAEVNLKDRQVTTDTTRELPIMQKGKQVRQQRQMASGVEGRGSIGIECSLATTLGSCQQAQLCESGLVCLQHGSL